MWPGSGSAPLPAYLTVAANEAQIIQLRDTTLSILTAPDPNNSEFDFNAAVKAVPASTATSTANYTSGELAAQVSWWDGANPEITELGISVGTFSGTNPGVYGTIAFGNCPPGQTCYINVGPSVNFETSVNLYGGFATPNHTGADNNGNYTAFHVIGAGSTPSINSGDGAGSSPSIGLVSGATDLSGYFTVTTGSGPAPSSPVATLYFGEAYASVPKCFAWPANPATQALVGAAGAQIFPANTQRPILFLHRASHRWLRLLRTSGATNAPNRSSGT